MKEELQKIYDSEINIRISSFWDADWSVAILVGGEWESSQMLTLDEVIPELQRMIKQYLPESTYAKNL